MTDNMERPTPPAIVSDAENEALEPIRMIINRAAAALGPTEEIIADSLRIAGIRGLRFDGTNCPEREWLQNAVDNLTAGEVWVIDIENVVGSDISFAVKLDDTDRWVSGEMVGPTALGQFGGAFDRGEYPDLIKSLA